MIMLKLLLAILGLSITVHATVSFSNTLDHRLVALVEQDTISFEFFNHLLDVDHRLTTWQKPNFLESYQDQLLLANTRYRLVNRVIDLILVAKIATKLEVPISDNSLNSYVDTYISNLEIPDELFPSQNDQDKLYDYLSIEAKYAFLEQAIKKELLVQTPLDPKQVKAFLKKKPETIGNWAAVDYKLIVFDPNALSRKQLTKLKRQTSWKKAVTLLQNTPTDLVNNTNDIVDLNPAIQIQAATQRLNKAQFVTLDDRYAGILLITARIEDLEKKNQFLHKIAVSDYFRKWVETLRENQSIQINRDYVIEPPKQLDEVKTILPPIIKNIENPVFGDLTS